MYDLDGCHGQPAHIENELRTKKKVTKKSNKWITEEEVDLKFRTWKVHT